MSTRPARLAQIRGGVEGIYGVCHTASSRTMIARTARAGASGEQLAAYMLEQVT